MIRPDLAGGSSRKIYLGDGSAAAEVEVQGSDLGKTAPQLRWTRMMAASRAATSLAQQWSLRADGNSLSENFTPFLRLL